MDDTVDPDHPRQSAWLIPRDPESRWPVFIALITAIALQLAIPRQYRPFISLELVLLAALIIINPVRMTRFTRIGRITTLVLLTAITADNAASAAVLDYSIVTGQVSKNPAVLLGSGAAIFLTNVIVFAIWFWEIDLGGPLGRAGIGRWARPDRYPDFLFPQTDKPDVAPRDWQPRFVDYLYLSLTNVMAFSPTDTMPLTRRAKAMMTVQSIIAVSTLALVIARAVNVLK